MPAHCYLTKKNGREITQIVTDPQFLECHTAEEEKGKKKKRKNQLVEKEIAKKDKGHSGREKTNIEFALPNISVKCFFA